MCMLQLGHQNHFELSRILNYWCLNHQGSAVVSNDSTTLRLSDFLLQTFETVLKSWSEKQKLERPLSPQSPSLNQEETAALQNFVEVSSSLIKL